MDEQLAMVAHLCTWYPDTRKSSMPVLVEPWIQLPGVLPTHARERPEPSVKRGVRQDHTRSSNSPTEDEGSGFPERVERACILRRSPATYFNVHGLFSAGFGIAGVPRSGETSGFGPFAEEVENPWLPRTNGAPDTRRPPDSESLLLAHRRSGSHCPFSEGTPLCTLLRRCRQDGEAMRHNQHYIFFLLILAQGTQ
jgi:hypothetical protein